MDYLKKFQSDLKSKKPDNNSSLDERKRFYIEFFDHQYQEFRQKTAKELLNSQDAFDLIEKHSNWMDAWIHFTWLFVYAEESQIMAELSQSSGQKLSFLESSLPHKKNRREEIEKILFAFQSESTHIDSAEYSYYQKSLKAAETEEIDIIEELQTLREIVPQIEKFVSTEDRLLNAFLIFARGGYGRRELTFSSDIDLGYCVNISDLKSIELQIIKELIKRMEQLFVEISLDLASQYFELDEDLSRFGQTAMLHTIPSILESRTILGQTKILSQLKEQILQVCPKEKMIRYLQKQMNQLEPESSEIFLIKEGFGGLRHLQYAFWMVLIVVNYRYGDSKRILDYLRENGWILDQEQKELLQALELFFELRNFIGLFDCFAEQFNLHDEESRLKTLKVQKDLLDDQVCAGFLILKKRFQTIDYLDRFRIHSIKIVSDLSHTIVGGILDKTITEKLPGFILYKHLGTNQITQFQTTDPYPSSGWNIQQSKEMGRISKVFLSQERFADFFLNLENLCNLFKHIGRTGNQLSSELKDGFSSLIPQIYKIKKENQLDLIRRFIFDLFITEYTHAAVGQMIEIASPLSYEGKVKTLLGFFLPEVNQMRYLLRNTEIHEYPLCIHSLKALEYVEKEIENMQKVESDLWRFIDEKHIFALKWSVFFHDLGKIDPYKNHEEYGPILSAKMLFRLGWEEESETLDLIRLLVENHQSVVRFSQLSTYLDLGILKFFELAQRDPVKVLLLYMVNISDFKSLNSTMHQKTGQLEKFFEKTISILSAFKTGYLTGSLTELVNSYLDQQVKEIRFSVLLQLLLAQCCNQSLEEIILIPLQKLSAEEATQLENKQKELENSLVFLKLAELDATSLENHRFRFTQLIQSIISDKNVFELTKPLSRHWDWFFSAVPNRYLLSSPIDVLTSQLQQFESSYDRSIRISYVKGTQGEYDTILFFSRGDLKIQARIAYALSWRGVNIENGKINKVIYSSGDEGLVGYFRVSQQSGKDELSNTDLETVIENLVIPPLNPLPVKESVKSNVKLQLFNESEKGYLVVEKDDKPFSRVKTDFVSVKISLFDASFCYYKIMRSFEAINIIPQQVTITTIGNQIIDYFYIAPEDKKRLEDHNFRQVLTKYLNAEISL